MFRSVRQCGFLPILQSFGSTPLDIWDSKVKYGCIRRVTDEQVRALALELSGTNVSTCFVSCPKNPRASLGILMPFFVMIVKNMNRYFTFEITVLDDRNVHRRFRMSNFQKMIQIQHFSASMPLCLEPGWNEIYFDLADITRKAYKTNYMQTTRVQIHANCRLRVVYFCDRIYEDKDIPQKLKMFLPTSHHCRKKDKGDEEKPEFVAETDYEGESGMSEEEAEEMYFVDSMKSIHEAMGDLDGKHGVDDGMSLISRIEEEGDEDFSDEDLEEEQGKVEVEEAIKEEVSEVEVKQEGEAAEGNQNEGGKDGNDAAEG